MGDDEVLDEPVEDFVDLSELPLLESDDFLVTELRVDVDMFLDYLFEVCFVSAGFLF